jgi:hypothetical protein
MGSLSSLNYWRIGSTTLWQGAAVQLALRLDYQSSAMLRLPDARLGLMAIEGDRARLLEPVSPVWTSPDGRSLFEIPTSELATGAYEVQLFLASPQHGVGRGRRGESSIPPELRKSIAIRASAEWKP